MRKFTLIVCLAYLVFSCKEEDTFNGKGLILISPSEAELKATEFQSGDSLVAEFVFLGSEDIIFVSGRGKAVIRYLEGATDGQKEEFTSETFFFGTNHRDLEIGKPFKLKWQVPDNWEPEDLLNPKIILQSRILAISVVTENHILVYEYELGVE